MVTKVQYLPADGVLTDVETRLRLHDTQIATASGTCTTEQKTATAGQTVFTLSNAYIPGTNTLQVYVNGLLATGGTDYTETSSTVVTFVTGMAVWDELQFIVFGKNVGTAVASNVSFTPAGTGAVATTVQSKLRQSVSVKDFGAVGDGVTDDTAAINAAIQYAKTSAIKCVEVPSGNYKTSGSIVIGGNFGAGFEFVGYHATITCTGNVPIIDINCRVPDSPPQVRMNLFVHGFTLVGPGKANTSTRGIKAQRGAGIKVENCSITGVYIGLHGFGNLISHYSDVNIYTTFTPLQFEPDGI